MQNWDEYVSMVGHEVSKKQDVDHNSYKTIGDVALKILEVGGESALKEFAEDVKETYGTGYSFHTYKRYAHIVKTFLGQEIPEDLSLHALNKMTTTSDPLGWLERVKKEALTGAQVVRLIKEKEIKRKKKCPHCKTVLFCHACKKEA